MGTLTARAPGDAKSVSTETVVSHAGSGVLITALKFALENLLDITSTIVGWGQSGEAWGKLTSLDWALVAKMQSCRHDLAFEGHGYTVDDFKYLVASGAANQSLLASYQGDRDVLADYLEQWPEIRRERERH